MLSPELSSLHIWGCIHALTGSPGLLCAQGHLGGDDTSQCVFLFFWLLGTSEGMG